MPAGRFQVTQHRTELGDEQFPPLVTPSPAGNPAPTEPGFAAPASADGAGTGDLAGPDTAAAHRKLTGPGGFAWPWVVGPVLAAVLSEEASKVHLATATAPRAALAVCLLYIGAAVIAVTPGVALLSLFLRRGAVRPATAFGLLLAGSGGAAMAAFWADTSTRTCWAAASMSPSAWARSR